MRLAALMASAFAACGYAADPSFVIIPDVHLAYGLYGQPHTWNNQVAWIVANHTAYNIQGVFSVGDINAQGSWTTSAWQGSTGSGGFKAIDALGIPWGIAVGNHDNEAGETQGESSRIFTQFNASIGYSRISGKPWFGGYWSGDPYDQKTNFYETFTEPTTGRKFLVLFFEIFPRPEALTWAADIINAHETYEVLVITHGYMKTDGSLIAATDGYGPDHYNLNGDASGIDLRNWAKRFPNMRAIFCGHWIASPYHAVRKDTAADRHPFYGVFTNFQATPSPTSADVLLVTFGSSAVTFRLVNTNTGAFETASPNMGSDLDIAFPWAPIDPRFDSPRRHEPRPHADAHMHASRNPAE